MKHIIIKPQSGWVPIQFREWVEFFDLFIILIQRDIKLRYKQTFLGITWVVLQPLITSCLIALIFGRLAKLPSDGIPYILFALSGMLPWSIFSQSVTRSSTIMISEAHLISKVYFPRIMIPVSVCTSTAIDFLINLVVILILCAIYGMPFTFHLLFIPLFFLCVMAFSIGLGLLFSSLCVFYRDFNHLLPFAMQIWMYGSPLVYSSTLVPEKWKFLYTLNPLAGIIDGFRWALLPVNQFPWQSFGIAAFFSITICIMGIFIFHRFERYFVDVI
jgi:lipopolysaccharide transport system permease protein